MFVYLKNSPEQMKYLPGEELQRISVAYERKDEIFFVGFFVNMEFIVTSVWRSQEGAEEQCHYLNGGLRCNI